MTRNERTSKRVATIAAKILASPASEQWIPTTRDLRALAASLLTQTADQPKTKRATTKRRPPK